MVTAMKPSYLCVGALTAVSAFVGTGWSLSAHAGQNSRRPYIPKASEIRPVAPAPPAANVPGGLNLPAPQATDKGGNPAQKQAGLTGIDVFMDENTGIATAKNFTYTERDMTVTGAKARYGQKTKVLEAEGNLVLDNPKNHMTGDKARYDSRSQVKHAIVTGTVVIVMKPKEGPAGDNARDVDKEKSKGATAFCDQLDYFKLTDVAILKGHVVFKQTITKSNGRTVERTVTADHAEYDGKAEKVHLFPPVKGTDTDGQKFDADTDVFIGTKEGAETVQTKGRFTITFNTEDEENKDSTDAKPGDKSSSDKNPPAAGTTPGTGKQENPPAGGASQDPPKTGGDPKPAPPEKKGT